MANNEEESESKESQREPEMTFDQKWQLSMDMNNLSVPNLGRVLKLI